MCRVTIRLRNRASGGTASVTRPSIRHCFRFNMRAPAQSISMVTVNLPQLDVRYVYVEQVLTNGGCQFSFTFQRIGAGFTAAPFPFYGSYCLPRLAPKVSRRYAV